LLIYQLGRSFGRAREEFLGGVRSAAKISALHGVTELTIGLVVVYTKHHASVRPRTDCSTLALLQDPLGDHGTICSRLPVEEVVGSGPPVGKVYVPLLDRSLPLSWLIDASTQR